MKRGIVANIKRGAEADTDRRPRIADHPASRIDGLLPWNWKGPVEQPQHAAA
jgi:hypothetical protein